MAIQIQYNARQFDITLPNAYVKIDSFNGNIDEVNFNANIFATQEARLANKNPIGRYDFTMTYQDGMTYNLVYTYLKSLPGFENAVDV